MYLMLLLALACINTTLTAQSDISIKSYQKIADGFGGFGSPILTDDRLGEDVENLGDLDGDGVNDIAIGAAFDDFSSSDCGTIYVCFMNANNTIKSKKNLYRTGSSRFGTSVANIGDLDGDGVIDLAVGAITENSNRGSVYILYMNTDGTIKSSAKIQSGTTNFPTLSTNSFFGAAVERVGDINGDGILDIAVGAPGLADGGTNRGGFFIIYLNTNGSVKKFDKISDNTGNFNGFLSNGDNFGNSITNVGDWNGDGKLDLLVGANNNDDTYTNGGAIFLVRLDYSGTTCSTKRATKISANTSTLLKKLLANGNQFGLSTAWLSDFGGTYLNASLRAILVGSPFDADGGSARGAVYMFIADTAGNLLVHQKLSENTPKFKGSLDADDRFGRSVCNYGNKDTNGVQSFVVGSTHDDEGVTDAGAAYIFNIRKLNASVLAVIMPTDTICGGTLVKPRIVIRNSSTIKISNIPVTLRVKGVNSKTILDTFKKTILPGQRDTLTLPNAITFNNSGIDSIWVSLKLPGDLVILDDSIFKNVYTGKVLTQVNFGKDTNLCAGETYRLDLGNSFAKHKWSNGDTTRVIVVAGPGKWWGTAFIGQCLVTDTINISYYKSAEVKLGNDTNICFGQSIQLNSGFPDAKHFWSNGDTNRVITISSAGKYIAYVSYNRCTFTDTIEITSTNLNVNLGRDTTLCQGQTYTYDAGNAGALYQWSTGATTQKITVNTTNTYSVRVYFGICQKFDTARATFLTLPTVNLGRDTTLCKGEFITLDAGNSLPGQKYLWSNGSTNQTLVVSGASTYFVRVSNGKCPVTDTIVIKYISLGANLGKDTVLCQDESYIINSSNFEPGASYLWNTGQTTSFITVKTTGLYSVRVFKAQCSVFDTVKVDFLPIDSVNLGPDQIICEGETITINAGNPGQKYLWSTGATTQSISVTNPGTYGVTVNNGKCFRSGSVKLTREKFEDPLTRSDTSGCQGTSIVLDARNPGASYLWSTGDTTRTITATISNTYTVRVRKTKCFLVDSIRVNFIPSPVPNLGSDNTLCAGTVDTLDAGNPGAFYYWSTGARTRTITVRKKGTYYVTISNGFCSKTDTINVDFYNPLIQSLPLNTFLCKGADTSGSILTAGQATNYLWYPTGEITKSIKVTVPGIYRVTLSHPAGCSLIDSTIVELCPSDKILVPGAFTPDEDGLNDIFRPGNNNYTQYYFAVYNRWGQMIYETNDQTAGWDGKYKGKNSPEEIYIWKMIYRIRTSDGTPAQKIAQGSFILFRH